MTGSAAQLALEALSVLVRMAPDVIEMVTGTDRRTLADRIERARLAVDDPIDTTEGDDARHARLGRIIRGEA